MRSQTQRETGEACCANMLLEQEVGGARLRQARRSGSFRH